MELLKDIANISGKSGLYRILKPSRSGVIVESLDDKKERQMVNASARVSILKDITIYTEVHNKVTPLSEVFVKIKELHGENVEIDAKNAANNVLFDFLASVMPDFDRQKVYHSDIRKMISWYNILAKYFPEALEAPVEIAKEHK